jgi:hypothetical protein
MKFVKEVPKSTYNRNDPKIDAEVAELKKKPGQWALVRERATGGNSTTYKKRGCEVTMRTSPGYENIPAADRRYDIYARWPRS